MQVEPEDTPVSFGAAADRTFPVWRRFRDCGGTVSLALLTGKFRLATHTANTKVYARPS